MMIIWACTFCAKYFITIEKLLIPLVQTIQEGATGFCPVLVLVDDQYIQEV